MAKTIHEEDNEFDARGHDGEFSSHFGESVWDPAHERVNQVVKNADK